MMLLNITRSRWRELLWWDTLVATAVAVLLGVLPNYESVDWLYRRLIWMEVAAASALLGLLLTGISITLSAMRDDLLSYLNKRGRGLYEEIWPFWITAILAMVSIVMGIVFVALFGASTCAPLVRATISLVSFFTIWAVLSVLAIIRLLVEYAQIRGLYHDFRQANAQEEGVDKSEDLG